MNRDFLSALREGVTRQEAFTGLFRGELFTYAETSSAMGVCMTVSGDASFDFAKLNCFYNRGTDYYLPFDTYYTAGLDFTGKTLGVIGHMPGVISRHGNEARKLYVFELEPKDPMDLPAEREQELLPECDIVVITGSALVNGTLSGILDACPGAYTVLTGPSVPKAPQLLELGIDRLCGLCVTDREGMALHIRSAAHGNPYRYGMPFLIQK